MVARQQLEQLVLTLPFEGGQPKDLAVVQLERDAVDLVAEPDAEFEHNGAIGGDCGLAVRSRRALPRSIP